MKFNNKPLMFFLWIVFIFPVLFLCMLGFSEAWRFPAVIPEQFSGRQAQAFVNGTGGIVNSFFLSLIISFVVAITAVSLAFYVSKRIAFHPDKQRYIFFAYLPFVFSPVIYAASLNYYFVWAGLSGTAAGVMIAQFIIVFPYNVILFLSHWNLQMQSYEHLALTLGAKPSQVFKKVIIPLSKNILLVAFFQSFIISWFEFGLTNFIGIGQVQTLTVKVFQYIGEANVHLAAFSSLLLVVPPLILLWLNKRFVFHEY